MKRTCEQCGNTYFARQDNQRFCGTPCSNAFHQDERRRGIELIRSQTYYGRTLVEAAENQGRFAAVGAEQLAPFPVARQIDPCGPEPFHDGTGEGDRLGGGSRGRLT